MHTPVMLPEVLDNLALSPGNTVFDGTCGCGGHAAGILERILPGGKLIVVDKDNDALDVARRRLSEFEGNVMFVHGDFKKMDRMLNENAHGPAHAAVFDLGVSSLHLDEAQRGFSYREDGPLDMRMDRSQTLTAREVVNRFSRSDLEYLISRFGEERHASLIARAIVNARDVAAIETTGELESIVYKAVGRYYRSQKLHPAARTFQAIRIYVNGELASLEEVLEKLRFCIHPTGRVCFLSFHSLEDRIVKRAFSDLQAKGVFRVLTKRPLRAGEDERGRNPRSRSAKLRVAERLR